MNSALLSNFRLKPRALGSLSAVAGMGLIVFVVGLFIDPARAWSNWLLAAFYFTSLALFGTFFIAIGYLTRAGWPVVLRRIPEAMTAWLPVALVTMLALALGMGHLYEWVHPHEGGHEAHLMEHKAPYLNVAFFFGRMLVYFAIWVGISRLFTANSRRQDTDGELSHTVKNTRYSAIFAVLFALSLSLASFDWLMSLEATWFSTIFGIYQFAGLFQGGIAALIVLVIVLRRMGYMRDTINENHLHNLGQWLIALSVFWAYIWVSQLLLIWYTNIPEETTYYLRRSQGEWWALTFVVNPLLNFAIPFLALLPRPAKRSEFVLLRVAVVVLVGHWLDLWIEILPYALPAGPSFSFYEIGTMLGFGAAFVLVFFKALERAPLVPLRDPYFQESLHHHI
jgi:hypothetical protein